MLSKIVKSMDQQFYLAIIKRDFYWIVIKQQQQQREKAENSFSL